MVDAGRSSEGLARHEVDRLSEIAQQKRKPGAKGYARRCLHERIPLLIAALKEGLTLSDIKVLLSEEAIAVSIASIRKFLMSDLADEYRAYLKLNGRGHLKNRGCVEAPATTNNFLVKDSLSRQGVAVRDEKISNPSELRRSLIFNDVDES